MGFSFDYGVVPIRNIKVNTETVGKGKRTKAVVTTLDVAREGADPIKVYPSKRFWTSLQRRFALNKSVFRYFSYGEVFERVSQVSPNSTVRYCLELTGMKKDSDSTEGTMLAVSNPNLPIIQCGTLMGILNEHKPVVAPDYATGVVRSVHAAKVPWNFKIGDDEFSCRFVADTPIDGYGKPAIYVSLLRHVCSNGAIGYSPAFRMELSVGKKNDSIEFSLERALASFNHDEAYTEMAERFRSSSKSWASVAEAMMVYRTLVKVYNAGGLKVKKLVIGKESGNTYEDVGVIRDFSKLTGDLNATYGLTNIDAMSAKKQQTLPARCTVYDLLNFSSEVATHHATPAGARQMQALIGTMISNEYDLEGTRDEFGSFDDFFVKDSKVAAANE